MARRPKAAPAVSPIGRAFASSKKALEAVSISQARAARSTRARLAWAKRKAAAEQAKLRAQERRRSGLRKRAADILLDLLERIGVEAEIVSERLDVVERREDPDDPMSAIVSVRYDQPKARATATFEPFWPSDPPLQARYDRTVRAFEVSKRDALRVEYREAAVRVCHLQILQRGETRERWESLVSLTKNPHALIGSFDDAWEDLPEREHRDSGDHYAGMVFRLQVYMVEHLRVKPRKKKAKKKS